MRTKLNLRLFIAAVLVFLPPIAGHADSEGPSDLTLSIATVSQQPVSDNELPLTCRFFDQADDDGLMVWEEKYYARELDGVYSTPFDLAEVAKSAGDISALDMENLWVELEIDGDVLYPRIQIGNMRKPFSLQGTFYMASGIATVPPIRSTSSTPALVLGESVDTGKMLNASPEGITLGGVTRTSWSEGTDDNLGNHTATQDLDMNFKKITNVASPSVDNDAATKGYVDSSSGDDLGDHEADQNLRMSGRWLSGDGDNEGVYVDSAGNVGIGTVSPKSKLHIVTDYGDIYNAYYGDKGVRWNIESLNVYGARAILSFRHRGLDYASAEIYTSVNSDGSASLNLRTFEENNHIKFITHNGISNVWDAMVIMGNGNVGIGTSTPNSLLHVDGAFKSGDATIEGELNVTGDHVMAKKFLYASDERLKQNVTAIEDPLEIVEKLSGVQFEWKESGRQDIGLIAQEVRKVLPELVHENPETGYLSVEYANVVAVLIEGMKQQEARFAEETEKTAEKIGDAGRAPSGIGSQFEIKLFLIVTDLGGRGLKSRFG